MLGGLALLITIIRPHRASAGPPPAPRGGVRTWIRGGASARLRALIQRAPFGAGPAVALLVLGLVPLVLGLIEAFTSALLLPNRLALLFPGPAIALLATRPDDRPAGGGDLRVRWTDVAMADRAAPARPPPAAGADPDPALRLCVRSGSLRRAHRSGDRCRAGAAPVTGYLVRRVDAALRARHGAGAAGHRRGLRGRHAGRLMGCGGARPCPAGAAARRPGAVRGQ